MNNPETELNPILHVRRKNIKSLRFLLKQNDNSVLYGFIKLGLVFPF